MRCAELQPYLLDGLKKSADPALPAGLAQHLEDCPQCRELAGLWQALGELPQPAPGLGARFQARLALEPLGSEPWASAPQILRPGQRSPRAASAPGWGLPLAAAVLLMVGGAFAAGYSLRGESGAASQDLSARLRRGSAGDRLETIALVTGTRDNQGELLDALLERVMADPSEAVRLSAVEALYLVGSDPRLGDRLAEALPLQQRPQVQLALVDLMVALRERRAAQALHRLVREQRLGPEAQQRARTRLAEQSL